MVGGMTFLAVRLASMLGDIVGRVVTVSFTPSIGVLLLWIALATSCSPLFYVANLLYNFSDLGSNKLHSRQVV